MERQGEPRSLSVVIPTRDTRDMVLRCLGSLGSLPDEVLVVDDGSEDGTAEAVRSSHPEVTLLRRSESEGFSRAVNRGVEASRGDLVLLLNSDTELDPGGLEALRAAFEEDIGIVGASLVYPGGKPQWSGGREPSLPWLFGLASGLAAGLGRLRAYRRLRPVAGHGSREREVEWVTGAALALRREVWDAAGPLDESFRFYGQDLELCTRARRAGWKVVVCPAFRVVHHHGATIGFRAGGVARHNPEYLWRDLIVWMGRHRGPAGARLAAAVVACGAALRILGRAVGWLFVPRPRREAWRHDSLGYRRGLRAVLREL